MLIKIKMIRCDFIIETSQKAYLESAG